MNEDEVSNGYLTCELYMRRLDTTKGYDEHVTCDSMVCNLHDCDGNGSCATTYAT